MGKKKEMCSLTRSKKKCDGVDYELQTCNTEICSRGSCCSSIRVDLEGPAFKEYPEFRGNYEFMYTSSKYGDVYENTIGSEW